MINIDLPIIVVTLIFIVLDIVSGLIDAIKEKNLNSTKMREGLYHKIGYILVIVLCVACEWSMTIIDLGFTLPILIPSCVYIITTEIVSIIENIKKLNPHLVELPFFKDFKNKNKDEDDKNE